MFYGPLIDGTNSTSSADMRLAASSSSLPRDAAALGMGMIGASPTRERGSFRAPLSRGPSINTELGDGMRTLQSSMAKDSKGALSVPPRSGCYHYCCYCYYYYHRHLVLLFFLRCLYEVYFGDNQNEKQKASVKKQGANYGIEIIFPHITLTPFYMQKRRQPATP